MQPEDIQTHRTHDRAPARSAGGSADSHVIRYRADLDGLRAVAVWSVIVFHLVPRALPGGYLGVDMFFVLSGYLITAIIWREQQQGRFSLLCFYDRRIRRIVPALLALLAVTTVAASILLLPADLIGYGKSLLATLGFVANIYFWRDTNYFSANAATKPLLHLWSLGVEEQFYIVFPLILLLLARVWRRAAFPVVAALTLASFAFDVWLRAHGGSAPAFFLLPARAWELGMGALVALLPERIALQAKAAQLIAAGGTVLLVAGLAIPLRASSLLPAGLLATAGTACLVISGRHAAPFANRFLGLPPLTYFGLTSYSLYLWHWPLIVFGSYYLARGLTPGEDVLLVAVLIALAHLSWRTVEQPFRDRRVPVVKARWLAGLGVGLFACAAVALILSKGMPWRLNARAAMIDAAVDTEYHCPLTAMFPFGASRACPMNLPSGSPNDADTVLLGNSHAQMYEPVVEAILRAQGRKGLLVPLNGCLPTVSANTVSGCVAMARANLAAVMRLPRVSQVIVGLDWAHGPHGLADAHGRRLDNRDGRALQAALDDLIARIERGGKRVVLVGPLALPGWSVASVVSRDLAFGHPVGRPLFTPSAQFHRRYGAMLRHFAARRDIAFVRPDLVQCGRTRCEYIVDGHSLFADGNHIAAAEAYRFRTLFAEALAASMGSAKGGAPGSAVPQ